jgi:HD-GYP domain-containing protein (c-di-GMP phosphodiesterase class II)
LNLDFALIVYNQPMLQEFQQHLLDDFFGHTRKPWQLFFLITILALSIAALVYITGGTKFVYVQLMYLPILLVGLLFEIRIVAIFAIFAGLLVGPLMPLEVSTNLYQPTEAWLLRLTFFIINGVTAGAVASLLHYRIGFLEKVKLEIAITYGRTLRALVVLIAERDDETADHSERVAFNAVKIGETMNLSPTRLEVLYWAALLHDLGKIGIAESILNKPAALTAEERLEMQRHVEIGYRVIVHASSDFLPIAQVVAAHHERMDGTGYPNRLKGEAILTEARILTVIDVFEALTSRRPYHEPVDSQTALSMIKAETGTHFDQEVVELFSNLLERAEIMTSQDQSQLEQIKDRYHGDGLFLAKLR